MKEIRYPDGTVRHIYAGPEARKWRPSGTVLFIIAGLATVIIANWIGIR